MVDRAPGDRPSAPRPARGRTTGTTGTGTGDLRRTALVVVDVQQGFDDPSWGRGGASYLPEVLALLGAWRSAGRPVVLVRHDSTTPGSPPAPGRPGHALAPGVDGPHDLLVVTSVSSAFHGEPDLDAWLRAQDVDGLVVCGRTTNHCCETTARVGGDLGHRVLFAVDATSTFDRVGPHGGVVTAEELVRATAADLHGELATVVTTADLPAR